MNFDAVIIGGGLAGLTCGIALQQQGKRCAIINNGQAAIDFSSGSLDLLSRLPNGENVVSFDRSFSALSEQLPQHPYSLFGKQKVLDKAQQFSDLAEKLGLNFIGSSVQNHLRVSPLGGLRGTWLSPSSIPTVLMSGEAFAYRKIAVLGIEGYHDFQPQLLAENLKHNMQFAHCEVKTGFLHIPELDLLRSLSREFRSVHIAQALEQKVDFDALVSEIEQTADDAEAVFLPACFGLDSQDFFNQLQQKTKPTLFELPTLPPSLLGNRQHQALRKHFEQLGGTMMNGDRALRAEFDEDTAKVRCIFTQIHEDEPLCAEHFILASGSFFSNGLVCEFDKVYEPVFQADIVQTTDFNPTDRFSWTDRRFASPQPYHKAGVIINAQCQVQKCGAFLTNLYAVGAVIGGYNPLELGCSSGVAVVTALSAAEHILQRN
ncbi:anaerobic glycerol-3-phosphate dehydrogenase subunit B [Pasteurellaceae bacterium Pebbles2]|nr:anaerobic glycerol-3-phosphate dehydrogenase subunit B [Pasteurellaceae bacterium Pebbles2]